MKDQITPKDETSLIACTREGIINTYTLDIYDDCYGPLWVYGHEFGPTMVIRASTFETAYEIAIDESLTIAQSEVPEAYGFNTQAELDAVVEAGEYPDLIEGYRYQSNSTGTGIVNVGHYEWFEELTPETIERFDLKISIAKED